MIILEEQFSPRVNPADENYPFGSIKDNTSPGANDGTPLAAVWGNDWEGFAQAAMTEAGITPSGLPDTAQDSQLLDAVKAVASGALRPSVIEALRRSYAEAGFNLVDGSFEAGGVLVNANDVLLHEASGKVYSGAGPFPQTVDEDTNPSTGGFTDQSGKLLKTRAVSNRDMGQPRYPLGYSPSDTAISAAQADLDNDLMARGGLNLAKKFRGIRRNMTALSVRGGRSSVPADDDFAPQITGVSNARGLAAYGSLDGVTAYVDAYVGPREAWETVASATYTANTCTISDAAVAAKIMIGDVLKTSHATPAWGIVTGITGTTITVDEWATDGTTVITPVPGTGFVINPIFKAWGLNLNVALLAGSQATTAVAAEIGVINHSQSTPASFPNGMDLVMLTSTYGGGAAYIARAVKTSSWQTGYNARGCLFNFFSADGLPGSSAVHAGFMERSGAVIGMKFYNKNTYSMAWSKNDSYVDVSGADTTMALGPGGQALRKYDQTQVLTDSGTLKVMCPTYLVKGIGLTLTLPAKANMQPGHHYKLMMIPAGDVTITADANIDGAPTRTYTMTARSILELYFDGTYWQSFK